MCDELNLNGCGTNSIDPLIRSYVDSEIQNQGFNYSLPYDPCDFDLINMSWILSISDLSLLSLITADQVLEEMPCEVYIQMPSDFLDNLGLSNITTESYWFGPPDGHCTFNASRVLNCSDPDYVAANYTESEAQCPPPFVPSSYATDIDIKTDGYDYCSISCAYYPYMGDIAKLDDFNMVMSILGVVFCCGFFVNEAIEVVKTWKSGKLKLSKLPLTFDIPIVIAFWMIVLSSILIVPHIAGKAYFSCETGTEALVQHARRDKSVTFPFYLSLFLLSLTYSPAMHCSVTDVQHPLLYRRTTRLYFNFPRLYLLRAVGI